MKGSYVQYVYTLTHNVSIPAFVCVCGYVCLFVFVLILKIG